MKAVLVSARQKKRKRAEFEPVLQGNLAMKLEVARSKVALAAEVELKEDALRLLSESTNANLQMEAKILKNMVGCQELKRRSRWLTDDMKVLQRKYNNQSAELADLKSRLLEQHENDSYTFNTRKISQVQRRATAAREGCQTLKKAVRCQYKQIKSLHIKAVSDSLEVATSMRLLREAQAKLVSCEVNISELNAEIEEFKTLHLRASSKGRPFADAVRICFMDLLAQGVSANILT